MDKIDDRILYRNCVRSDGDGVIRCAIRCSLQDIERYLIDQVVDAVALACDGDAVELEIGVGSAGGGGYTRMR